MRNGVRKMMTAMGVAMASLALAGSGACQTHTHSRTEYVDGGHRISLQSSGEVRFSDDDRGVAYVEPGARVAIEEELPGGPDRRVEYRNRGGGVERAFYRDGRPARPSADDEAWIARMIERALRESGVHAPQRVARIYRQGGVDAVLREIGEIGSDGAKRAYYTALLRQPLRAGETARVLRDAGNRIASDGDKRATLEVLLDRGSVTPDELAAMLEAAAHIASDGDKGRLLIRAAERDPLTEPSVRQAFFRTAATIASDGDKSRVLIASLSNDDARREAVADALRTARSIASDGDKSRVLMSVRSEFLGDRAVRTAYESALQGIASDGDRSRAALYLVRSLP